MKAWNRSPSPSQTSSTKSTPQRPSAAVSEQQRRKVGRGLLDDQSVIQGHHGVAHEGQELSRRALSEASSVALISLKSSDSNTPDMATVITPVATSARRTYCRSFVKEDEITREKIPQENAAFKIIVDGTLPATEATKTRSSADTANLPTKWRMSEVNQSRSARSQCRNT